VGSAIDNGDIKQESSQGKTKSLQVNTDTQSRGGNSQILAKQARTARDFCACRRGGKLKQWLRIMNKIFFTEHIEVDSITNNSVRPKILPSESPEKRKFQLAATQLLKSEQYKPFYEH
jgi:hypothetical protein